MQIEYRQDVRPAARLIAELYRLAPLYRPVQDEARIAAMYAGANVVVTAWAGERLVGILRGWTDEAYDGYVCDLAIHPECQKLGVGKELLRQVTARDPKIQWVLRASKVAADYYEHLGWKKIENGWYWPREPWPGQPG